MSKQRNTDYFEEVVLFTTFYKFSIDGNRSFVEIPSAKVWTSVISKMVLYSTQGCFSYSRETSSLPKLPHLWHLVCAVMPWPITRDSTKPCKLTKLNLFPVLYAADKPTCLVSGFRNIFLCVYLMMCSMACRSGAK